MKFVVVGLDWQETAIKRQHRRTERGLTEP